MLVRHLERDKEISHVFPWCHPGYDYMQARRQLHTPESVYKEVMPCYNRKYTLAFAKVNRICLLQKL